MMRGTIPFRGEKNNRPSTMKKKPYSPPTVKTLTPDQARKFIADRKNCTEEEAAEFLESLQQQKPPDDKKRNGPPKDNNEQQEKKRPA